MITLLTKMRTDASKVFLRKYGSSIGRSGSSVGLNEQYVTYTNGFFFDTLVGVSRKVQLAMIGEVLK